MKTITLSGVIGWDVGAQELRDQLKAANGEDVEIIISSPGGFVSTGLEMFNLIRNYAGKTTARLSGYAMSIASYIPLAADKIIAEDNAIYMIHNVRGGIFGDHNDILNYGATTKGMSKLIARAYAKKTGKDMEEVEEMMDKETYFFGQDMIDHAFVDELIGTDTGADQDPETAKAMACMAFSECTNRMTADMKAVKQDLAACASILASAISHTTPKKKEKPMDLTTLKAEHPELVTAIAEETLAQFRDNEILLAQAAGAAAEQARIQDVRAQAIPGHETLIEQLAFDGKSTGADAALAIVAAEKALRNQAADQLHTASNPAVPVTDGGDSAPATMKREAFDQADQQTRRAFLAAGGKVVD